MTIIITVLLALLVCAIITIDYLRIRNKELNRQVDISSSHSGHFEEEAARLGHRNSELLILNKMLKSQIGGMLGIVNEDGSVTEEELEDENPDWEEEEEGFIDEASGITKEQWDAAFKEAESDHRPILVFNTMAKKPETNQEAFERYYQARKGKK